MQDDAVGGGARAVGIDLAWLVAIAGLVAAPTLLRSGEHAGAPLGLLPDGPPVALLAVLAGCCAVLAVRPRLAARHRAAAARETLTRGLWLGLVGSAALALGAWLELVRSAYLAFGGWGTPIDAWLYGADLWVLPVATALQAPLAQLGVALALAAAALLLPVWALAALAAAWTAGGGLLLAAVGDALRPAPPGSPWGPTAESVRVLLVGDPWAALMLLPWVLVGMLAGRLLLSARERGRERALHGALLVVGLLLAAAAIATSELALAHLVPAVLPLGDATAARELLGMPGVLRAMGGEPVLQLVAMPGSGTSAEAVRAGGLALAVVGAAGLGGASAGQRARRALAPALAAGAAPVTVLLATALVHALLLAVGPQAPALVEGWSGWAVLVAAALGVGALLAALRADAPLERWMDAAALRSGGPRRAAEPLAVALPDERSISYAVRFRAPAEAVWQALTDPRLVPLWLPDPGMPMTSCAIDARTGGGYRFEHGGGVRRPVVVGEYLHVERPVRIVERQWQEGGRRPPVTASTVLEQHGDVTVLHGHEVFESQRLRDSVLPQLGIPAAAYERLAALVERGGGDAPGHDPVTVAAPV
ncbi:SRPBCC domain-containing protein [Agrococcus sediminis]|uniref:SRPBCC domain-containing protein n=1 Tax=Agrococcus sediminis TaxID=2599924 RepID=UPI003426B7D6